jgi:hypothetical protein
MCPEVDLMVGTVGTGGMSYSSAISRSGISVRSKAAGTFGGSEGVMGKGPIGMGRGERSG